MSGVWFWLLPFGKKTDAGLQTQVLTEARQLPKMKWAVFNATKNGVDCSKLLLLGSALVHFCRVGRRARFSDFSERAEIEFLSEF